MSALSLSSNQPLISIKEFGRVTEVKKAIARVSGLSNFMNGQLVKFSNSNPGLVVGFDEREVLVLILGDEATVRIGQEVYSVQEKFSIPVGEGFLGRIVNALAEPADGKGPITDVGCRISDVGVQPNTEHRLPRSGEVSPKAKTPDTEYYPVFREAPEAMDRGKVTTCLETGTKIIDAIIPISCGQRQLIIGDRMTGKTSSGIDAILNQKGKGTICIYCCIGKSFSAFLKVVQIFKSRQVFDYTTIVAATASAGAGEQYLAPYSACTLGEYFMHTGKNVLVVFDDLTKHAWAYRQISLLLERPPGREAYPGDIYYVHSQLMERSGKLKAELGSGSMTFLPIVDTLQGDVTGYIPSNLISMVDGQIYLSSALFAEGFKPAIDFSMSVSIIGNRTQNPLLKKLSSAIRLEYAQYKELLRLTKLKSGLTEETERKIHRGEVITAILAQDKNNPVSIEELIALLYALDSKILDALEIPKINKFKNKIWGHIKKTKPQLIKILSSAKELTPELKADLDRVFTEYFNEAASQHSEN